jgi:DNA-binding NarL/FixJ family response regulator
MRRLRVLIADDHRLLLKAVRLWLEKDDQIEVVAEADSGTKVLPLVGQTSPDVLLLDIRMPGIDGLTVLERVRARYPDVRVAMLSALDDPGLIQATFDRGADGFILKHIDPADLAPAVRLAAEGETRFVQPIGPAKNGKATAGQHRRLSDRELTILQALQSGLSNNEIAERLFITEQTVKFHLTNIYRKLGVNNRTEAVRYAFEHGLGEDTSGEAASRVSR